MPTIKLTAPAKINLDLLVGNRRADGFHEISSLMQAISLADELTISIAEGTQTSDSLSVSGPNSSDLKENLSGNLILSAISRLRQLNPEIPVLSIKLVKNIPIGGGLGGGSTDAASTLIGVNQLCELGLADDKLAEIGSGLGSDIPFFFSSGSALVGGRGESMVEIDLPLDYCLALITPPIPVSTAAAYLALGRPQSIGDGEDRSLTIAIRQGTFSHSGAISDLLPALNLSCNDFEAKLLEGNEIDSDFGDVSAFLRNVTEEFRVSGSLLTRLSGSGSTVFGIYDDAVKRERLKGVLGEAWQVNFACPISLPVGLTSLE